MKLKTFVVAAFVALIGTSFDAPGAIPVDNPATTQAAFLYGYTVNSGQLKHFVEGYRRHLQWHRRHHDPLIWYGWFVTSGRRVGMFIDGSFGVPFAAFDERVDPEGDQANAAGNLAGLITPAFRSAYVLRPDLGTGEPLEKHHPWKTVQVFRYTLRPGMEALFETVVRAARRRLEHIPDAPTYTWYRRVEGGTQPVYMLMVARGGWASYGRFRATLAQLAGTDATASLKASVKKVTSEIWQYRPDLSLVHDVDAH